MMFSHRHEGRERDVLAKTARTNSPLKYMGPLWAFIVRMWHIYWSSPPRKIIRGGLYYRTLVNNGPMLDSRTLLLVKLINGKYRKNLGWILSRIVTRPELEKINIIEMIDSNWWLNCYIIFGFIESRTILAIQYNTINDEPWLILIYKPPTVVGSFVLFMLWISTCTSLSFLFCHSISFFLSLFVDQYQREREDVIYIDICKISPLLLISYSLHWIAITSDFFDQSVVCKFYFEVCRSG